MAAVGNVKKARCRCVQKFRRKKLRRQQSFVFHLFPESGCFIKVRGRARAIVARYKCAASRLRMMTDVAAGDATVAFFLSLPRVIVATLLARRKEAGALRAFPLVCVLTCFNRSIARVALFFIKRHETTRTCSCRVFTLDKSELQTRGSNNF